METQTKTARPATLGLFKTVEKLFNYFNPDGKKVFERIFIGKEFDGFILSKKLGFLSNDKDILHLIDPEIFKNGNSIQAPATISFINGEINVFYSFLYDPHFEIKKFSELIKFWNCPIESENWKEINDWVEFNPGEVFEKEYDEAEFPKMWEEQRYRVITQSRHKHIASVDYSFFPSVEWCILNEKVAKTEKIIAWKLWQPL
ncbi:hypothetical protein A3C57_02395 [Candidatus Nomurabacteria bacterium RIFCSPHIGHO2_02_FULL_33_12]|uniref:Uncharacterized protein n=1 Tax=Candidatus Nomurabacteria bacterium RIFCSPLOWO2_01_FULL_33_17 TaxID=1801764 RepID=A0A1F6WMT0_9BACT|nr:MAG: hypothetical protein A3C57_02395 [Candidatus Nomurabacteria bacterium RIFCSPHIGHO2_02_FULL_33_12]OGI83201.1 MAG: hypothetical protein A2903_00785 [Candidatus Nomurabacteria bacterium RIFCSPLOWO2_01_FULL_33_17]